jgi:hypothetical protein
MRLAVVGIWWLLADIAGGLLFRFGSIYSAPDSSAANDAIFALTRGGNYALFEIVLLGIGLWSLKKNWLPGVWVTFIMALILFASGTLAFSEEISRLFEAVEPFSPAMFPVGDLLPPDPSPPKPPDDIISRITPAFCLRLATIFSLLIPSLLVVYDLCPSLIFRRWKSS